MIYATKQERKGAVGAVLEVVAPARPIIDKVAVASPPT